MEIQVALLSYQVAVACEMPETAEMERQSAIKTFHRIGRYHGWISSPNVKATHGGTPLSPLSCSALVLMSKPYA